jgi:SAM-dependent methyltransferase
MSFLDLFSQQAALYAEFRPEYPPELFAWLASTATGRRAAWDCATGSGQAALGLARQFEGVVASDASVKQLAHARQAANVRYFVGAAEAVPLASASLDLVTAAQAAHWFDLGRFYAEARRVLRPGGTLALWCYPLMRIEPQVDQVIDYLYEDVCGPYWNEQRRLVERCYADLPFPFQALTTPPFAMTVQWRLRDLAGYLLSWSAVQAFQRAKGYSPLREVEDALSSAWGDPQTRRAARWPVCLRVARLDN